MQLDYEKPSLSPVQSSSASNHYNHLQDSAAGSTTVEKKGLFNDEFYNDALEFVKNIDSDDDVDSKMTTISHTRKSHLELLLQKSNSISGIRMMNMQFK